MASWGDLLRVGATQLAEAGIGDARLEAELLLAEAAGLARSQFLARLAETVDEGESQAVERLVKRRLAREPLAYILGRREFFGRDFFVNSNVLIPRPETELLVHRALELLEEGRQTLVIDVGTGSGAIGLSILAERGDVRLLATDVSLAALEVAKCNARRFNLIQRVGFLACDLLAGIRRAKDAGVLVVSNLPYVPIERAERLQPEVRDFEPHVALFGAESGLGPIRRLMLGLNELLGSDEFALLEIDEEQGATALELARMLLPAFDARILLDASRSDRVVELRKRLSA